MQPTSSEMRMHEVLRYPRGGRDQPTFGSIRNLYAVTRGGPKPIALESGINPIARSAVSGLRPAILLSSTPRKAGSATTPWHDVFDLDRGHVRFFGDHKGTTQTRLGTTRGNKALLEEFTNHLASTPTGRRQATPLILFRAVSHEGRPKGFREFCGIGVLETAEQIVQWDASTGSSYTNYVYDIAVLGLGHEEELFNWKWINDRREHASSGPTAIEAAPLAWRRWVASGHAALPTLRRRVSRSRVRNKVDQLPAPGTPEAKTLQHIYSAFTSDKHAFETLASRVVGRLLQQQGAIYHPGWITKASGDNGVDFVSRLDLGSGPATVRLVVLGQAKCVARTTTISAGDLARVVARLRRGWIGAFVTTGSFSEPAQEELLADEYPILLVDGLCLAQQARLLAAESFGDDLSLLLANVLSHHPSAVAHRRPEEILSVDGVNATGQARPLDEPSRTDCGIQDA